MTQRLSLRFRVGLLTPVLRAVASLSCIDLYVYSTSARNLGHIVDTLLFSTCSFASLCPVNRLSLSRVITLTRDIDIGILSVRLSVRT